MLSLPYGVSMLRKKVLVGTSLLVGTGGTVTS